MPTCAACVWTRWAMRAGLPKRQHSRQAELCHEVEAVAFLTANAEVDARLRHLLPNVDTWRLMKSNPPV